MIGRNNALNLRPEKHKAENLFDLSMLFILSKNTVINYIMIFADDNISENC